MTRTGLPLLATLVLGAASIVSGQTAASTTTQPPATTAAPVTPAATATDSDLVTAAKSSGVRKKARLSITDKDVKKTAGSKSATTTAHGTAPLIPAPPATVPTPDTTRIEIEARVEKARTAVTELTAEVARLEEAFYETDDPDYRDRVVMKAFNQAKEQLENARQELAAAREALEKIEPAPSTAS